MDCLRRLAVWLLLLALAGCGGSEVVVTTGTVTQDGKPLANALIAFLPEGDTLGNGGAAKTGPDGKYTLVPSQGGKGLPPGQYKVTISRLLRPDGSEPDPNTPPIRSDARETLPAIYSNRDETTLKATVSKDARVHDFALQAATPER